MKKMDKNRYFQIRSRKYTKTKVTDIQRLYSKWLWLVTVVYKPSLSYTKIPKYIPQNLLRAYLPDDLPEMIQRLAKVLCN